MEYENAILVSNDTVGHNLAIYDRPESEEEWEVVYENAIWVSSDIVDHNLASSSQLLLAEEEMEYENAVSSGIVGHNIAIRESPPQLLLAE
jgi:hypothetical protein